MLILSLFTVFVFLKASFFAACRSSLHITDRQSLPLFDDPKLDGAKRALFNLIRRPARLAIALSIGENGGYAVFSALVTAMFIINLHQFDLKSAVLIAVALFAAFLASYIVGKVLLMHYLGTPEFILVWAPVLSFLIASMLPLVLIVEKFVFLIEKPDDYLARVGATELDFWRGKLETDETLAYEEKEMIRSIYEFGETTAREIMTPRTVLKAIDVNTPPQDVLEFFAHTPYSRIPIYEGTTDSIIGVIHVKNVLNAIARDGLDNLNLRKIATEPFFTPETKKLDELLQEIRNAKRQMVIVLDEYGGMSGIVTLEDILEEIVGEIQDEYDQEVKPLIELKSGAYLMSARLPIEELNEALGFAIEEEDFDTVGGLASAKLGRIPSKGDNFTFEGWDFHIVSMEGKRVNLMRVEPSIKGRANLEKPVSNGNRTHAPEAQSR